MCCYEILYLTNDQKIQEVILITNKLYSVIEKSRNGLSAVLALLTCQFNGNLEGTVSQASQVFSLILYTDRVVQS